MKKLTNLIVVSAILFGASSASAQIYVKIRPVVPVVVVTDRPSPGYVWIGEEWTEDGGNYRYAGSYWANPPHPGYKWKKGHWNNRKDHGNQWVRGSWQGKKEKKR